MRKKSKMLEISLYNRCLRLVPLFCQSFSPSARALASELDFPWQPGSSLAFLEHFLPSFQMLSNFVEASQPVQSGPDSAPQNSMVSERSVYALVCINSIKPMD